MTVLSRPLFALRLFALGMASLAHAQGPPPAPVRVAPAVLEDVAERRMVTGQLNSLRVAEVASQEAGVVVELLVEIGQRVEAGQVLARLDDERLVLARRTMAAERAAAESAIAEERAGLDRWGLEVESLRTAGRSGASNARELRDAEMAHVQAGARLQKAERDLEVYDARLALLDRRLKDMKIVAPFAGAVTRKLTDQGQWLDEGASVCEIVETDTLEVVLDVPQRFLPALAGAPLAPDDILIRLDAAAEPLRAENLRVVPKIDERARTFRLVGLVRNPGGLAAGLSVVGWVPTGASGEHLLVPTDAVMRNDMGAYLYVARQMGEGPAQAMPANITVLFEMPGRVVVESPALHPGDSVIVEGNERLYPTAPVAPSEGPVEAQRTPGAGEG